MVDGFDPDAYLADKSSFDPDQYLSDTAAQPQGAGASFTRALVGGLPGGPVYEEMKGQTLGQMSRGVGQVESLQPWEMAKGAGNIALGGLGYLGLPISAPLHAAVGEPTERAVSRIPVVGQTVAPYAGLAAETAAGFALPTVKLPSRSVPMPAEGPYGITQSAGEAASDIGMRAKEQAAIRSGEVSDWVAQRQAQIDAARENLQRGLDPEGQIIANTPTEAGEMVSQGVRSSRADAKAGADALYEDARTRPGEIHAGVFEGMPQSIKGDLTLGSDPVIIDNLTPQASRMIDYLDTQIGNLKIKNKADPFGPPIRGGPLDQDIVGINLAGIDQWRKNLGSMRRAAFSASQPGQVSQDARAAQMIMDNFDRRITEAINNPNTFNGPQASVDAWNGARAAYSDYRSTFTPQGTGDAAGRAMNNIVGTKTAEPMEPNKIIDTLMGANGPAVAKRLSKVLGDQSPEWIGTKQAVLQRLIQPGEGMAEAGTGQQAQRLSKFLNGDLAKNIYTPQEQGVLRGYANLMRDLTMPPGTYAPSEPAIRRLQQAVAQRIGGIIGAVIGRSVSPFPIMGELAGYTLGKQAETAVAKRFGSLESNFPIVSRQMQAWSKAQSRAAAQPNPLNQRAAVAASVGLDRALSPFGFNLKDLSGPAPATAKDQEQVPGPVEQRKAGGRVEQKAKVTKTASHYRGGNSHWSCAWCTMFIKPSSCSTVRGHISPRALCDYYEPQKGHERLVDNRYDVVTGANSSKKPTGPIYIDRHIPEWSPKLRTKDGKRVRLWTLLSIHEDEEQRCMEQLGDKYDTAHTKAEAKEKAALEKEGGNWKQYSDEIDALLKQIEHEKVAKKPPMPLHVKPEQALDHHKGKHRK